MEVCVNGRDFSDVEMIYPGTHRCQNSALAVTLRIDKETGIWLDLYYYCYIIIIIIIIIKLLTARPVTGNILQALHIHITHLIFIPTL